MNSSLLGPPGFHFDGQTEEYVRYMGLCVVKNNKRESGYMNKKNY